MEIVHSTGEWRSFAQIKVGTVFFYRDKISMKVQNAGGSFGVVYLDSGKTLWGASVPHGNEEFRIDPGAFMTVTV